MTPERLNILHTAFHTSKLKSLHKNITPTPKSLASELLGLLSRKAKLERKYHSKKIKDSYSQALPNHVHTALQKWALVTQEKMASPLDFTTSYSHYWSADSQNALFGAHLNSLPSQFTGFSVCHLIYDKHTTNLSLRHAIDASTQPFSVLRQLFCTMMPDQAMRQQQMFCDALCGLFKPCASSKCFVMHCVACLSHLPAANVL